MTKPRLIKKYKNRRLYDLETSKFITVDNLLHYVLDGITFQVEDATSGKDLTSATLLQIIVEMDDGATQCLSSAMLRQLIVMAHHPMSQSYKSILEQMMMTMEKPLQPNSEFPNYQKAMAIWSEKTQDMLNQWQALFRQ